MSSISWNRDRSRRMRAQETRNQVDDVQRAEERRSLKRGPRPSVSKAKLREEAEEAVRCFEGRNRRR
jgi:hypothetical protein